MSDRVLCFLTNEPIDVIPLIKFVTDPKCGAISTFMGVTRDNFEEKQVLSLQYEAHERMALKELDELALKVAQEQSSCKVVLVHRLGEVPISETSLCVMVSSAHRRHALESVSSLVDAIKSRVPIWKKELYTNGTSTWKENSECFWTK
ncbi:Molybdopterin synthase catalytic subunit [Cichlidogyrus casuarinus]|uniref:Molybdopterin synthase catalytic subunit n=1 Tax=Cichlidogyrus casuarinus TaxID=1844966 RepID=A0ABD2PS01_9PLAT